VIVYLDTSAFVKLVIEEDGTDDVRRWFDVASLASSSVITYAESCAALARRARHGGSEHTLKAWLAGMESRWVQTAHMLADERLAGGLAIRHGLRGMDSIHLAAAVTVRERAHARSESSSVAIASFDRELLKAAEREGFATLGGPPA
jgi:predicted nucleic acid-binding protein